MAACGNAFLQDLLEYAVMKGYPLVWGEWL